jgi:hypothetical protein
MNASPELEITPVLRWLSKFAGLLALASAIVAGLVGTRMYETQQELARIVQDCGPCCERGAAPPRTSPPPRASTVPRT